jgi:hypothetical protein
MHRIAGPFAATFLVAAFAALAFAAAALGSTQAPGAARCVEPVPIDEAVRTADVVIVGTVSAVAEEGTRATVRVEEIWRGPALDAEVVVWGGPGGRTSVDRTFDAGTRYLFTIAFGEDGRLTDNLCSSTTEWDASLEAIRPPGAMQPAGGDTAQPTAGEAAPFDPWSVIGPAGVALVVAIALIGAGLLARGRQANG